MKRERESVWDWGKLRSGSTEATTIVLTAEDKTQNVSNSNVTIVKVGKRKNTPSMF